MADGKYINIDFPFKDSGKGFYLELNDTSKDAIRADLLHLLMTNKGERLYMPDFGSDLRKHIFQPNDKITHTEIKNNLNETIKKFIPNLQINEIEFRNNPIEESITVALVYTVSDNVFSSTDTVEITF